MTNIETDKTIEVEKDTEEEVMEKRMMKSKQDLKMIIWETE